MFGLELYQLAGVSLGMFLGGLAKGISGVALPLIATAVSLFFVDVPTAVAAVALSLLATNLYQAISIGDVRTPIKRFWPMIIAFIGGLYIGAQLIRILNPNDLLTIVGCAALIFAVSQIWKPNINISKTGETILNPIVGILGGTLGGITTMWGPPLIMYMFILKLPKEVFVQTVTVLYLLGAVPLVAFYFMNGILAGEVAWLSAFCCIPALIGTFIGGRVRAYINEDLFRKVLITILVVIGVNLIRRGIFT